LLGGLFGIVPVLFILFDIVKVDTLPCLGRCKHYIPGCHNNFPGRQYKGRIAQKDAYMTHISGKTSLKQKDVQEVFSDIIIVVGSYFFFVFFSVQWVVKIEKRGVL